MTDELFQSQARELDDDVGPYFCLQTYIVWNDKGEWLYKWCWDLSTLFTTLEEAETERAEFHAEDRTRIVKMNLRYVSVESVHEADGSLDELHVAPGRLF